VLANPEKAVYSSQNSFFEKILLYALLGYTLIILNDMIAIVIQPDDITRQFFGANTVYVAICRFLLGVFDFLLLIAYVILYLLFISLIHRNDETFGFMKF